MTTFTIQHEVVTKTGDVERIVKASFEVEAESTEEAHERVKSACSRIFRKSGAAGLKYPGEGVSISVNGCFRQGVMVDAVIDLVNVKVIK